MRTARFLTAIAGAVVFLFVSTSAHANCQGLLGLFGGKCSPGPASPDPGGTESPDQPVPLAGKQFGFNSSLAYAGLATPEQELGTARGAGATVVRMPVPWRGMQPDPQEPPVGEPAEGNAVSIVDAFYENALARGITPVFVTYWAPAWASKYRNCGLLDLACQAMARSDAKFVPDRPFLDDYERYVRAVKTRWPRALIESWNEPNLHWSHPNYTGIRAYAASPAYFAEIQCAAHRGSKAVNADPVLAPGWAWHRFADYTGAVYSAGGADCWDLGNLHIYSQTMTQLGANSWFARRLHELRTVRTRYGDTDPIWVTEIGWTTSGGSDFRVTEADQADVARRAYNRLVTMDDVQAVLFHTLRDAPKPDIASSEPGYGFGFARKNWTFKPVYCGFASRAGNHPAGC